MIFRDPRDVFLSLVAFRKREQIIETSEPVTEQVNSIMQHYQGRLSLLQQRPDQVTTIRYEELVATPRESLNKFLDESGLHHTEDIIEQMIEPLSGNDTQASRHITAGSQQASLSRRKNEMPADVQRLFARYRNVFEVLGYDTRSQ